MSRYPWDLESWGSRCRSCWFSGATDEEGNGSSERPVRASSCRDLYKFWEPRGFRSEDQEKRCLGLLAFGGESRERTKAGRGDDNEGDADLFKKESTSGMVQVLRVEILCLGINKTWRAEGADAGEAAGSASEDRSLFLE